MMWGAQPRLRDVPGILFRWVAEDLKREYRELRGKKPKGIRLSEIPPIPPEDIVTKTFVDEANR